jgi:hypothetical protein
MVFRAFALNSHPGVPGASIYSRAAKRTIYFLTMRNSPARQRYGRWLVLTTLAVGVGVLPAISARAWLQAGVLVTPITAAPALVALSLSEATLTAPASITMKASVSGTSFTRVNFYAGSTLVGSAAAPPYEVTWRGAGAGTYTLTAEGIDLRGTRTYSAPLQVTLSTPLTPQAVSRLPLIQKSSMRYLGGFKYPNTPMGASNYGYAGVFSYNPRNDSIVAVGHDWHQLVAEFSIPELRIGSTAAELARGTALQNFGDPTDGKLKSINPTDANSKKLGGLLPWGDSLIVSAYSYYDGIGSQSASHFVSSSNLAVKTDVKGPFNFNVPTGLVSGYMAPVPEEWREVLGGPAFVGQCCIPVVSRTSNGPALFTFNPSHLGTIHPVTVTPLLYYPVTQPLAAWDSKNELFNGTTTITGVALPRGSRSVLFFGKHGTGKFCYGEGKECSDPEVASKGNHAYPYVRRVWAYDLLDLIKVKDGALQPWEPRPYATWDLDFPIKANVTGLVGATYDTVNNRLFVGQPYGDGTLGVIHVYQFNVP